MDPALVILSTKIKNDKKNLHYLSKYISFIRRCQNHNSKLENLGYTEDHHICPKAKTLFPEYTSFSEHPWNKTVLTGRQHAIAHWMLARAFGGAMWQAFQQILICSNKDQNRKFFNSRMYEEVKKYNAKEISKRFKGRKHKSETKNKMSSSAKNSWKTRSKPIFTEERKENLRKRTVGKVAVKDRFGNNYLVSKEDHRYLNGELVPVSKGVQKSELTKKKISESLVGEKHPNFGKSTSKETRSKISESLKGKLNPMYGKRGMDNPNYGRKMSEEQKQKISESKVGKKRKQITCPHCHKVGGVGVMKRWHFDNCKMKLT